MYPKKQFKVFEVLLKDTKIACNQALSQYYRAADYQKLWRPGRKLLEWKRPQ